MTALDAPTYRELAAEQLTEAQRTLDAHRTEAYTGICRGCGRPGPCDEQHAARARIAQLAPTPTIEDPVATAVTAAVTSVDDLRDAWLTIAAADDRAGVQLHGATPPRPLAWQAALTECWRALGLVHAGLAEARRLPGVPGGNAGELLAGLRLARADADRAAALTTTVRIRLAAAEDRLRRTRAPAATLAARHWAAAVHRLDLVTARLAIGARTLDRYAAVLGGVGTTSPTGVRVARPADPDEIARGIRAAGRLVGARRRRDRPGLWQKVRHELRREWRW